MTKEELIELLKKLKENKSKLKIRLKKLKNKRLELKNCEDIETSLTASYGINQNIHSKNKVSNKVLQKIEHNNTKKIQIEEEIKELEKEVRELREKVDLAEDRIEALKFKEKKMLEAYYLEGCTYEDIGNRVFFDIYHQTRTGETIKKIIDEAVEKMLRL